MRIARLGLGVVLIFALNATQMNLAITLRRIDHKIARLHLVNKAEKLTGVVRDRSRFLLGIDLRNPSLESLPISRELGEVTHFGPTDSNAILTQEKRVGVAGLSSMN